MKSLQQQEDTPRQLRSICSTDHPYIGTYADNVIECMGPNDAWIEHERRCSNTISAIKNLLEKDPGAARKPGEDLKLPIHLAASKRLPVEAIRALIRAYPEGLVAKDANGLLPLHYIMKTSFPIADYLRLFLEEVDNEIALVQACSFGKFGMEPLKYLVGRGNVMLDEAKILLPFSPADIQQEYHIERKRRLRAIAVDLSGSWALPNIIKDYPEMLREVNSEGSLPLHEIIEQLGRRNLSLSKRNSVSEYVKMMLKEYPGAARTADKKGRLPLHLVVSSVTSAYIFHSSFEIIRKSWPDAVSVKDSLGNLPLHYHAKIGGHYVEILDHLLKSNPKSSVIPNNEGETPLIFALQNWHANPFNVFMKYLSEDVLDGNFPLHCLHKMPEAKWHRKIFHQRLIMLVEKFPCLLKADQTGVCALQLTLQHGVPLDVIRILVERHPDPITAIVDKDGGTLLHTAIKQHSCSAVIEYLAKGYPELLKVPDNDGCLTLHLACQCTSQTRSKDKFQNVLCAKDVFQRNKFLVNAYPGAAQVRCAKGLLPIHYACMTGMSTKQGLNVIVGAHPMGLEEADHAGNYPLFYVCGKTDNSGETVELSRIFRLLRRTPAICTVKHIKQQ